MCGSTATSQLSSLFGSCIVAGHSSEVTSGAQVGQTPWGTAHTLTALPVEIWAANVPHLENLISIRLWALCS